MWWLPVIALLLVGQAAKAEEAPPPSRFDSITKGANDLWQGLPGLSMPPWSIPSIPMPGMPDFSMPDLSCCRFGGHHLKLTAPAFRTPLG
jgi:hypothetical protein